MVEVMLVGRSNSADSFRSACRAGRADIWRCPLPSQNINNNDGNNTNNNNNNNVQGIAGLRGRTSPSL
jgi:hypothetical protein